MKFKTHKLEVNWDGEQFKLTNQSAQDHGRYDFLKDVQRLEQIVANQHDANGYAILLTNDSAYWNPPGRAHTVYEAFRLQNGRHVHRGINLDWNANASARTKHNREESLRFQNSYHLQWKDYSKPATASYSLFRYLIVEVNAKS